MTKKELIAKLDELGGRIEDLKDQLRRAENAIDEAIDEFTGVADFITESFPTEVEQIEDDAELITVETTNEEENESTKSNND